MKTSLRKDEINYLNKVIQKIMEQIKVVSKNIKEDRDNIIKDKKYIWENLYEMDPTEVASFKSLVNTNIDTTELSIKKKEQLEKLVLSPYFGRIDFENKENGEKHKIYIGVHSFADEKKYKIYIYDWRSPISSMYYDYEVGKAKYEAPSGTIDGEIRLKRQYKIVDGKMKYMLESSVTIDDEILKEELSQNTDQKMKNIVSTIQQEQNSIIRDENTETLIIQGVAGSGKTSIALHRAAYLLYKHKDSIKSNNILIISPNKVFSDYISEVLPELGEEPILEMSFEDISSNELKGIAKHQTFYEHISEIVNGNYEKIKERLEYKSSKEFLNKLNEFIKHIDETYFIPKSIRLGESIITKEYILARYASYIKNSMVKRIELIAEDIVDKVETEQRITLKQNNKIRIEKALYSMLINKNILSIYRDFYNWSGKNNMYLGKHNNQVLYEDVFPLIYIKDHMYGIKRFDFIKHLIIDEMQDYTPVQYAVISKMFKCHKTILGDIGQLINPYNKESSHNDIKEIFNKAITIELLKSYRSTIEITNFAQKIIKNDKIIAIERHGKQPKIIDFINNKTQIEYINEQIKKFDNSKYHSMGIICKTQEQADEIYKSIADKKETCLLSEESSCLPKGVIICTSYMAKGLEFDKVIIPHVDDITYNNEIDRRMLYVACTRALHELELTYVNNKTKFLED